MNESYKLSFCIPTYNNSKAAFSIVTEILKSRNQNIEVVVSDNSSPDNTVELLNTIKDTRLNIYSYEKKAIPTLNWLNSLEKGQGKYLYLVMGRDIINHENIDKLINIIDSFEKLDILVAKDECSFQNYYNKKLKKISALKDMLWFNHPTGYIFEKKNFNNIRGKKELFIKADIYPENYIIKELLIAGNAMKINSGCNQGKLAIDKSIIKSQIQRENLTEEEMYYAPKRRTYQCYQILEMVIDDKKLELTSAEKKSFVKEKIESLLLVVSYGWKYCCTNPEWCSHYNQTTRLVTKKEMCENVFSTYERLCSLSKNNKKIYKIIKKYKYYTLLIIIRIYFSRINHYCERIKYYKKNYGFFEAIKILFKKKLRLNDHI